MSWYIGCLKKYADFTGRARRMEYWMFMLFEWLIATVLFVLSIVLSGGAEDPGPLGMLMLAILVLFYLGTLLPLLAVTVRRLHDTDKSGWWFLLNFIPLGGLVVLFFMVSPGTPGDNRFGADPLA